ncbi:MAG: ATP-dependent phosphofructokinase / diphosphate-dependent phosphofructokinase [Thermotogaceae bacterium]|jgi:6-phosphofructokinase 1|nr:ATP-dependent phosphofructokinase / diphosphate-dependent phosphofructokinase [Thermotogaceae bacterium]
MKKNVLYAQSGGVTTVINCSMYGVIKAAMRSEKIDRVFGAKNGVSGLLQEELVDLSKESQETIEMLKYTPSAALGSCRRKLKSEDDFNRLFDVFKAHNIGYFLYNGGNDSMDTAMKIHKKAQEIGYDLKVIGIPKTVDNDLMFTDHCPGYPSSAKYTALSIFEATLDVKAMSHDSTKVFVMESMGRHAGWIAASSALLKNSDDEGPHIILFPERIFNKDRFLSKVEDVVRRFGYCSIVVSEGIKDENGNFVSDTGMVDNFGNKQLGGVGFQISNIIKNDLNLKVHTALPDYLQRSSRHISSLVDVQEAIAVGMKAVEFALNGESGYMVTIERLSNEPYIWTVGKVELDKVANKTRELPDDFIDEEGFMVTDKFREYALPLIQGEDNIDRWKVPNHYSRLHWNMVEKKLPKF